jgi:4-hydroxybenzoate polyprenyltransferase/phosphoserine phosphatase
MAKVTDQQSVAADIPICVDLEGALLRSDPFLEGLVASAFSRSAGWALLALFTASRPARAQAIAELAPLDPASLPYNEELLTILRAERAAGRKIVLATAGNKRLAEAVAGFLGLFDEVICPDGSDAPEGRSKAAALVERFGPRGFSFAGNRRSDLPVWEAARSAFIVNASGELANAVRERVPIEAEVQEQSSKLRSAIQAMRPHQWIKNILVFVPIITAQAVAEPSAWQGAVTVFIAFCATASGLYIVNDLSDLAADRLHPRKRLRPFARAALPIPIGVTLAGALIAAGFALAWTAGALAFIAAYFLASLCYSLFLKELPLVDVFVLAGLYTLRVLAGGVASGHLVSPWLLAFCGFLFLSLALMKRTQEMISVTSKSEAQRVSIRRGYYAGDLSILQTFGSAAAFASSVVLALFIGSDAALAQYAAPEVLWGIVPLMLFWQSRLWLSTVRGHMHDDPIVYAARDRASWIVAAAVAILLGVSASGLLSFR